jgi:hypothetical protein
VSWELHVQGAGASFTGRYAHRAGSVKAIRAYAPKDEDLAEIARNLAAVQRKHRYQLQAVITRDSHHGAHSRTVRIEVENPENPRMIPDGHAEIVVDALRELMDWLYRQIDTEYTYQTADEQVDENIIGNEYTFTVDGKREG